MARPAEMRAAFEELEVSAQGLVDAAPGEVRDAAEDYRNSVDALVEDLSEAGFDPRNVDTLEYGRAVDDYQAAAVELTDAANEFCGGRSG